MKTYGKKALSVLLALVMCCTAFAAFDFSGLIAEAYTDSPTHTFKLRVRQTSKDGGYDGQDGGGRYTLYGKNQNGNGSQATISSGSIGTSWATVDGGTNEIGPFTSAYWPTSINVGCNICNNNSMFYKEQTVWAAVDISVYNEGTGSYTDWVNFSNFSLTSSTKSGGGGSTYKNATSNNVGVYPYAAKVATSKSAGNNTTDTVNITLNATGGSNKTYNLAAYVYDQYNVIWRTAPTSWSKSGTTACTTSLTTTGASETNTLTMTATNSTYQKATCTVKAMHGSNYHQWNVVITPTYKITYNVSGNGGTSAVPGPDNTTNTNTGSANVTYTIPNSTNYTAKKEKGTSSTGTWKFVGWNGSQSATTGTLPGSAITIDSYNDTLYAIFSKTATATFYWYKADGSRATSTNTKTVYNNATQYTFDVPKSSVPTTITVNGTTYTFAGWAVDSTTKTTADHAATVTTAARNIKNGNQTDSYSFYALYTGSVTLSYDNNGGSVAAPASQTANLTLNCGANTSAANNTSGSTTLTVNPDGTAMSRYYSSDFIGWKTAKTTNGVDTETAQYKDSTVTWAASSSLPNTITINKDTTLYAAYYDFRYNVKFYDNTGTLVNAQEIRHNFSATAPTMHTDSSDPAHTDSGSHYVFDHWEYTDGSEYKDTDKLTKLVNGYTYEVWGKYVGHKHIWGDPYNVQGATTCTTGQVYLRKCTVCNYVRQFETEPLGHDYIVTGVAEPTCTRPGSYGKKICRNCGELDPTYAVEIDGEMTVVTDENRMIPALGHEYGDEPSTVAATCTTAGYTYYTCSRCGDEFRASNIPATGHSWVTVDPIEATCTEGGHTGYTKCTTCGLFLDGEDEDVDPQGHDYVLQEETDSTCTEKGHYAYYQCSRCGEYYDLVGGEYVVIEDISVKEKDLLEHDYQPSDEAIPATCTEAGYASPYVCAVCGAVDPERSGAQTPALGHVWERESFEGFAAYADAYGEDNVSAFTSDKPCLVPNSVTYTCPDCGETYVITDELADHTILHADATAATCTAEGNTEYWYCDVCGTYFGDAAGENEITAESVITPKAPHTIITIDGEPATCTEPGIPDCYKCTVCNKLFLDAQGKKELTGDVGTIPALGHDWTPWVISKQPTDDVAGEKTRRCTRCPVVETQPIEATGHEMTFFAAVEATCTKAGNNAYYLCDRCGRYYEDEEGAVELSYTDDVYVAPLGHNMGDEPADHADATCAAEGYDKFVCSRCNAVSIVTLPKTEEHGTAIPYGEEIAATCAAPGQHAGTMCSVCGKVLTQPTSIPKLPHTPKSQRSNIVEVSCTTAGYSGDLYCAVCGQKIEGGSSIEATGHHLGALVEISAATCTAYGEKRRTCPDCGYYETYETPILGHQVVIDAAVPATCEAAGLTEGKHCSRCNEVLVAQETVDALGHNYIVTVVEPTCTKVGYTDYTCTLCRDTYKDNYTEKVAHVVGTPATCQDPAVCANCGRSFGTVIDHNYELISDTESTCTVAGVRTYKCTMCPKTYTETKELAPHRLTLEDSYGVEPTCTERGYSAIKCEVCGEYIITYDDDALGHNYEQGVCTRCGEPDPSYSPDTPPAPTSEKCSKCGLNHNGRTGLWAENGLFCRIIAFFRNIFKVFNK